MKHLWWIPIIMLALTVPAVVLAGSGDGGFDGVVNSIESRYHVRADRIPFMGLISFIARQSTHGQVGGVHVAEFEHFDAKVDGEELNRMVSEKIGRGWERIIRDTSRKGGEQTLVFMRKEGKRMGMFVVDLDGKEMNVVQVSVDPDYVQARLSDYTHHGSRYHESD